MRTALRLGFSSALVAIACGGGMASEGGPGDAGAVDTPDAAAPRADAGDDATTSDARQGDAAGSDTGDAARESGADAASADASCAGATYPAHRHALDMYVMLDQSGSMLEALDGGTSKWAGITAGLDRFVTDPSAEGVGLGLQYFALSGGACVQGPCTTNADCAGGVCLLGTCNCAGMNNDSCIASDYEKPAIEIAPLPGVASAIRASLAAHSPTTATATSPALQGAVDHARAWATGHPGPAPVVVLLTDGDPNECDTSAQNLAAIAAKAAGDAPGIHTFVIAVGAPSATLDGVAQAGGTSAATVVDPGGDVSQALLDALRRIRGSAPECAYDLPAPDGGTLDPARIRVQYSAGGSTTPVTMARVSDGASCPAGGMAWYLDAPTAPRAIILCDASCSAVRAASGAAITIATECGDGVP